MEGKRRSWASCATCGGKNVSYGKLSSESGFKAPVGVRELDWENELARA